MKASSFDLPQMNFDFDCVPATFLARPNRYLVMARLDDGMIVRAHCPDPGRLHELLLPGTRIFLSRAGDTTAIARSTQWDLRLVEHPQHGELVSLDTRVPNRLFREALDGRLFEELAHVVEIESEVRGPHAAAWKGGKPRSRFDYRLTLEGGITAWVEVKSASLVVDGVALFPDAVTERGRRHVEELTLIRGGGAQAAVVFIVQRADANAVMAHRGTDPAFAGALQRAAAAGVWMLAATSRVSTAVITLDRRIPVLFDTAVAS